MGNAPVLNPLDVAIAGAIVLVPLVISSYLHLGLEIKLLIGSCRSTVQLSVLGILLNSIFNIQSPALVLGYLFIMAIIASFEAYSRTKQTYKFLYIQILSIVLFVVFPLSLFANIVVMKSDPWYDPQCIIPITGMILGNCVSTISLALRNILEKVEIVERRIETRLAFGATRWESFLPEIRETMTMAMTPIINMMNLIGLVSIPGMMTGQILGGQTPLQAAYYQLIIIFIISTVCSTSSFLACWLPSLALIQRGILNVHILKPRVNCFSFK